MGEQQGPAFDPAALANGGGRFLDHADGLDAHAKALAQLESLRTAFAGSAAQFWPALEAALTGAGGQIQQSVQGYSGVGQGMRTLADGVTAVDASSGQGITAVGQTGVDDSR